MCVCTCWTLLPHISCSFELQTWRGRQASCILKTKPLLSCSIDGEASGEQFTTKTFCHTHLNNWTCQSGEEISFNTVASLLLCLHNMNSMFALFGFIEHTAWFHAGCGKNRLIQWQITFSPLCQLFASTDMSNTTNVYSRSPEPRKSLRKPFIQVPRTFLMAYFSYGTYS